MNILLEEYLKVHTNLSGEVETELRRFAREIDTKYAIMCLKKKQCKCGEWFLPNSENNKWCQSHQNISSYQKKKKGL